LPRAADADILRRARRVEIAIALAQNPKVLLLDRSPSPACPSTSAVTYRKCLAGDPARCHDGDIEHNRTWHGIRPSDTLLHFGEVIVEANRAEVVDIPDAEVYLPLVHFTLRNIDAFYSGQPVLQSLVRLRGAHARLLRPQRRRQIDLHERDDGLLPPRRGEVLVFGSASPACRRK